MRKAATPGPRELAYRTLVGRNILDAATGQHMTIHALAGAAGVSRSHLMYVLRGTANCSVDWLVRVAGVLGVEPSTLLVGPAA